MAEEVGLRYGEALAAITLVPSHGGVFRVTLAGEAVFDKGKAGRFPEAGEIVLLLEPRVAG